MVLKRFLTCKEYNTVVCQHMVEQEDVVIRLVLHDLPTPLQQHQEIFTVKYMLNKILQDNCEIGVIGRRLVVLIPVPYLLTAHIDHRPQRHTHHRNFLC